jgi:sigma-B regulation protein RsbU (phosphoserine phosphatase)
MLSVTLSMVLTPDSAHGGPLTRLNSSTGIYDAVPPAEVVSDLNQRFQSKDDRYFTMAYGLFDSRTGELSLTQAGHPSPVWIRAGRELQMLGEGGSPVGLWPDMEYDTVHASLCPGDRLVLYSDGVVECANAQGELFGDQRLLDYLQGARDECLPQMLAGLEKEMELWRGGTEFDDDVSL